jgi:HTH-type transcriptional regulator/antitoxin HigA
MPPGATIKEQLNDRGMNQKEFASRMDMSEKHISRLINGEVKLTPEVAVRLELVLGIPASFWNNLEAIYREKLIKAKTENSMEKDIQLIKGFPYNEMAAYGWIPETKKVTEKVIHLRQYFEVVDLSILENKQITKIACRRLRITEKSDLSLIAWAQRAKLVARNMNTAPISIQGLLTSIPEIRKMANQKPEIFCPKLKKLLSGFGIALVFLPHLKGSFLQGATFIDGNKIVVGLTARGKDADKFWFSFFHELAHIILGHIGQSDGTSEQDEEDANNWSANTLIPEEDFKKFISSNSFNKENILRFSENIGIAPGIVVGRLQKENLIKYNMMNALKDHYVISA